MTAATRVDVGHRLAELEARQAETDRRIAAMARESQRIADIVQDLQRTSAAVRDAR